MKSKIHDESSRQKIQEGLSLDFADVEFSEDLLDVVRDGDACLNVAVDGRKH